MVEARHHETGHPRSFGTSSTGLIIDLAILARLVIDFRRYL
eukprot:COSAG05_NODE_1960_length_3782_cov_3.240565_3_plen_41_part_00